MPRTFNSGYFYPKKTAGAWWSKDVKEWGLGDNEVVVTPMEDARGIGYEHHDEYEIMHTDFDEATINTAIEWCKLNDNKKRKRQYLDKITTLPRAKISHAIACAKEDYGVEDDHDAMLKLMAEGWSFEGDETFEAIKRKRYREANKNI